MNRHGGRGGQNPSILSLAERIAERLRGGGGAGERERERETEKL